MSFLALALGAANVAFAASGSDFRSLCPTVLKGPHAAVCAEVSRKFFPTGGTSDTAPFEPSRVGAPSFEIDRRIQYIVFDDPNFLPGVAYCYFVFQGWIDPARVSPDFIGLASTGFSVLNERIAEYQKWLNGSAAGKACRRRVERESGVPVTDLDESIKGYAAIIGLNPLASIKNGALTLRAVTEDMALTLNHERIHAYQVLCPDFERWGQAEWTRLPAAQKRKFVAKYSSYNWNDLKVAGREYAAFTLESKPREVLKLVGRCALK